MKDIVQLKEHYIEVGVIRFDRGRKGVQAMERMDELVEEVIQICIDVAEENHYERE